MNSKINYELFQEEAKDMIDYLKDILEMYYGLDKKIYQDIKLLREKLQAQYNEQINSN